MSRLLRWLARHVLAIVIPLIALGALAAVLVIWSPERIAEETTDEIWTCSMHPQVRLPKPGNCPICGMTLIPVSQLATEQARMEQQSGLETEPVQYRDLFKEIRTVGKLDYNERRVALITARIAGRVDRVYADFTGITVKKKDHLVDIYSPELYSAQAELFRSLESYERSTGDRRFTLATLESARTKLRLLGILPEQIADLEKSRKELTHLTIYAPIGGVVIEKNIREQQYVNVGDALYRIAELDGGISRPDIRWHISLHRPFPGRRDPDGQSTCQSEESRVSSQARHVCLGDDPCAAASRWNTRADGTGGQVHLSHASGGRSGHQGPLPHL
jgi:multidrug efflux pump subunit AcrA (membrane-fusion protein)